MAKKSEETEQVKTIADTDSEGLALIRKIPNKFKTVITGAEFKEFAEGEQYTGEFIEVTKRKKDGPKAETEVNQRAGAVMGYLFRDVNNKEEIIGASQQITEVMEQCKPGTWVRFTFLGQREKADGKKFNAFRIEVGE